MPRRDAPGTAGDWLTRARSSLALSNVSKPGDVLWEDLCYHAEQAAEKALKSVLVANCTAFRFVHDLAELVTALQAAGVDVPPAVCDAVVLTQYAVITRYPGVYEPVTQGDHSEAVTLAATVVQWAASTLASDGQ